MISGHAVIENESFQREMLEVDICFEELGTVYDMLAEKIANLKIRIESDDEVVYNILDKSELV